MDSRQLDYFISVVDNLSLAKAAAEFFFTPQAMRKHIEALEAEVGVPLLERSNKGVRPTEAGSVFYGYARKLRALSQESLTRTREAAGLARPRLTLGLYRNANLFLMPKLVGAFKERHPEVELAYVDLPSYQKIDEALVNGTIDATMTVGNARARKQGIRYLTIEYERPLCSVAVNDPLAAREQLRLEDLHGRTVVTFTPGRRTGTTRLYATSRSMSLRSRSSRPAPMRAGCWRSSKKAPWALAFPSSPRATCGSGRRSPSRCRPGSTNACRSIWRPAVPTTRWSGRSFTKLAISAPPSWGSGWQIIRACGSRRSRGHHLPKRVPRADVFCLIGEAEAGLSVTIPKTGLLHHRTYGARLPLHPRNAPIDTAEKPRSGKGFSAG